MGAVPDDTMGGQVRAGAMKAEHAEILAKAPFDGKRELQVGGKTVVTPAFTDMTAHERMILKGLFPKAKVKA